MNIIQKEDSSRAVTQKGSARLGCVRFLQGSEKIRHVHESIKVKSEQCENLFAVRTMRWILIRFRFF
ncbi:MAG: hypothetical protein C7B43_09110 [Sulfobacillus benefaciens]|uniref:Uncharacterized protein n=1 Tax=Sulfobacillus benefaciens TaxID=453960 RepID=A0A2T2X3X2_9FIRM|nr:MAG: hypothetical protein C7B43_09110 [Sulfobacillus benefaciens]